MQCYEYLAMHMQLKAELSREYPDKKFNELELEELLCSLNIYNSQELQERISVLRKTTINTTDSNTAACLN